MSAVPQMRWVAECGANGRWCDANEPPAMPGHENGAYRHVKRCAPCREAEAAYSAAGQILQSAAVYEQRLVGPEHATKNYTLVGDS